MADPKIDDAPADRGSSPALDRPIFLVGHARGGTTMLGNLIGAHPDLGPKPPHLQAAGDGLLDDTRDPNAHYEMALASEQKDIWFDHLPGMDVFATMGDELIVDRFTDEHRPDELFARLTEGLDGRRYFSKAPFNSFRVGALRERFHDAKIIAIYRDIHDVIGSYLTWSRRPMYAQMSRGNAIRNLARCWYETFACVEARRTLLGIETLRYEDLVAQPEAVMRKVWTFLELEPPATVEAASVRKAPPRWKRDLDLKSRAYIRLKGLRARLPYLAAGTIRP
ncbi:MAG: sulfotransferase [Planctomycetota bacterium]